MQTYDMPLPERCVMPGITVVGSGSFAPGEPVPNKALMRVMDTNDEWIRRRTGIEQRHFAGEGQGASDLALEAAKRAIDSAGLTPADIDYIIFCTMTPDYLFPGSGGLLGAKLGIHGVPALDIRQQCAAMPFAFQVADGLCMSGAAQNILVVGAEAHAGFMPWDDWDVVLGKKDGDIPADVHERATRHRGLAVIFGDGAGALVMRRTETEGHGLIGSELHTDGDLYDKIYIEGGGFRRRPYWNDDMFSQELHIPSMDGRDLFRHAVTKLPEVVRSLCDKHGVSLDDIDFFLPHQANDRINQHVAKSLKIPPEKVASNIAKYGNTSGATIPILFDEVYREGKVKRGDLLCFIALGAGLHWGASLMRL